LSDEGEQLLAHVADLMDGNKEVIVQNPVRNVRELLAVSMEASKREDSNGMPDVEAFLAASPNEGQVEQQAVSAEESVAEGPAEPTTEEEESDESPAEPGAARLASAELPVEESADDSQPKADAEPKATQDAADETLTVVQQPADNSQDEEAATAEQEEVEKPTRKVKKSRPKRKAGAIASKKEQAEDDEPPKLIFQQF
jgi:hypothetical protein